MPGRQCRETSAFLIEQVPRQARWSAQIVENARSGRRAPYVTEALWVANNLLQAGNIQSEDLRGKEGGIAPAGFMDGIGADARAPRIRLGSGSANCSSRVVDFLQPLPLSTRARHGHLLPHGQRLRLLRLPRVQPNA